MDSSSSASSSSPSYQYNGAVSFAASSTSSGRPRWPDLPIYESTPQYSNYGYDYGGFSHSGVRGGEAGGPGGGSVAVEGERREGDEAMEVVEKEHMFDKVVTPSDVGKLNRLVIPKQHAEKYFPLDSASGDSKGLLLNFEDRSGKSWRFRYSYWNSSQSYVMTKGWSRFVKEKKLDAGDIVSFHRGAAESDRDRFYIDWRRRPDAPPYHHPLYRFHTYPADVVQFPHDFTSLHRPIHPPFYNLSPPMPPPTLVDHHRHARDLHRGSVVGYNALTTNSTSSGGYGGNYGTVSPNFCHHQSGSVIYLGAAAAAAAPQQQMQGAGGRRSSQMRIGGAIDEPTVFDSVPVVHGGKAAAGKRLRLFGVNMDCTDPQDEQQQHHLHDFILDSDRISSSSGAESPLQLRLHNSTTGGVSGASTSSTPAIDLVDKGKSSMSLDLDI